MEKSATNAVHWSASNEFPDDLLWRHLRSVPAFRALLRATEARLFQNIELPEPVLDIGCGDGHFAQMTFSTRLAVGVDPWWQPLQKARNSQAYHIALQSMGDSLPFPSGYFGSVISNSVLEHIQDVQSVLLEANRVLRPDGRLVLTMPSHLFTEWLGGSSFLLRLGLPGLASTYQRFFNYVSRHVHTDPPDLWAKRLSEAGFLVERWQYYFSQKALRALELGHVQGLPSAIAHLLTGHWILAPWPANLRRTERWLRPYYPEESGELGAYMLFVAQKIPPGQSFVPSALPQPRPLELIEGPQGLEALEPLQEEPAETADHNVLLSVHEETGVVLDAENATELAPLSPVETDAAAVTHSQPMRERAGSRFSLSSVVLFALSLLSAGIAQSILSAGPPNPSSGIRWYTYSLIAFTILIWRQRKKQLPTLLQWRRRQVGAIPRRLVLYLPGLLLAILAYRAAGNQNRTGSPTVAFLLWATGIFIGVYALHKPPLSWGRTRRQITGSMLLPTILVFLAALLLRLVNLTEHPFMLTGVESSIGIDALNVARGGISSPFSTAWLTNPTLPLFMLALPIKLLGPSVLSVRLLSPFVGAATVSIVFLIGGRVWGKTVGLVAALLLAGSHWHIHYSRLGMTNIWDPLLTLVALGLIAISWEHSDDASKRFHWLAAGAMTGLNAYFFTSSRLLPLILLALLCFGLLFERHKLRSQWRHIGAAAFLALLVALPQFIYYRANPAIYLERANSLGILDSQSGWLSQEASRTGQSESEIFVQQLWQSALAFNYSLDRSTAYGPQVPLLSIVAAMLFVFGVMTTLISYRRFASVMLLLWVAVTIVFAGALLIETPSSHRLLVVAPGVYLLIAIGLVELVNRAAALLPVVRSDISNTAKRRTYLLAAMLAIAAVISLGDLLFYFGRYQSQHSFGDRNTEIAHRVADYLNELEGDWTGYFYGAPSMYVGFPTIPFLATGFRAGVNLHDVLTPSEPLTPATTSNQVHIILPERASELEVLTSIHQGGSLRVLDGFHSTPLFYAYEVRN